MKPILVLICLAWLCLSAKPLYAQQGIASKYVADVGIATDPEVVFSQDFETGSLSQILALWSNVGNSQGMSLISSLPPGSRGSRALEITSIGGQNSGGYLYKTFPQGYQQLYLRYYIRYHSGGTYHHGTWMGGYNPPTDYPQGGAGTRPTGNERFSVGAEPVNSNLRFDFYTYWMGMGCLSAPDNCWGNTFIGDPNLIARTDRWMCVEIMVKLNNQVGATNGELALWVDGQQIIHLGPGYPNMSSNGVGGWYPDSNGSPFVGFQWRNDGNLTINWLKLEHYTTQDPAGYVGRSWLDHIVLAKSYIGPMNLAPPDVVPPAPPTGLRVQ